MNWRTRTSKIAGFTSLVFASAFLWTPAAIAAPIAGLYDTGVDNAGVALSNTNSGYSQTPGAPDPHFSVTTPTGLGSAATYIFPGFYTNDTPTADWIGAVQPGGGSLDFDVGAYVFSEQFTAATAGTYAFSGDWAVDNCGAISVNGLAAGGTGTQLGSDGPNCSGTEYSNFESPTSFSFNANLSAGVNTIEFNVYNTGEWTSLFADNLSASCTANCNVIPTVPEPQMAPLVALALASIAMATLFRRRTMA